MEVITDAELGKKSWEEGVACMRSALEDCETFMNNAPPDNRRMKDVIMWYTLLTMVLKGPELGADLSSLEVCCDCFRIQTKSMTSNIGAS
jgi:hypothetical protein